MAAGMAEDPEKLRVSVEIEIQKDGISSGGRVHEMPMTCPIAGAVYDAGWVNCPGREGARAAQEKDPLGGVQFFHAFPSQPPVHSALAIALRCIGR